MQAIMAGCFVAFIIVVALWKLHPVFFMYAAGVAIVTACYMAEIISGGVTDNLSITASLAMIGISLVCVAFAFGTMFAEVKKGRGGRE